MELKNRRMQGREGRKKCMVEIFEEKRGMMVKEKGCSARREAQGAGGCIYIYICVEHIAFLNLFHSF